jgi:hypothetical protein
MDAAPASPLTFDRNPANPPLMRSSIYSNPLRRIRSGDNRNQVPDNRTVLVPPVLPGTTKTVELTIGQATAHTASPLGINIDQLSNWAQGNAINSLIPQGGTFEMGEGRIMVHTSAAGSNLTTLVVDSSWIFTNIGYAPLAGQTLTGLTGANAHHTYHIVSVTDQRDSFGNGTGRSVITVDSPMAALPQYSDAFTINLTNYANVPLAEHFNAYGNATLTRDNITAHGGRSSGLVTLGPGANNRGEVQYYLAVGRNVLQQNHTYQLTFWAKTATPANVQMDILQGNNHGSNNLALNPDGQWRQYTLTLTANTAPVYNNGIVTLAFTGGNAAINIDDVKLIDLNDQVAGSDISKTVVDLIKQNGFGMIRFWHPNLLPASLDDLIGNPADRPTIVNVGQTYSPQLGLPEMLELAKAANVTPWIVIPTTWSPEEMHDLLEYLGGDVTTPYGAKRAADGHPGSWFDDLPGIKLEAGNESWNGTFSPFSYTPVFEPYFERTQEMFHTLKTDPLYTSDVAAKLKLIVNGWQWVPWYTKTSEDSVPDADAVDVSAYTGGPNTEMPIKDLLAGVLAHSSIEDPVDYSSTIFGKEVYVYEEAAGELGNSVTAATESAYATSLGAGLAVIRNAMVLSRDYGISQQNLFTMFQDGLNMKNGYAAGHYGIFSDMTTAQTNPRPIALAAQLLNNASGTIIGSSLSAGWTIDANSNQSGAATTQAADAMVTLDGDKLVITLFNNTVADVLNTTFHMILPTLLDNRTLNPDWNNATFTLLSAPSVASNNEATPTVTLSQGSYSRSGNEIYAALPAHSMASLVIPLP